MRQRAVRGVIPPPITQCDTSNDIAYLRTCDNPNTVSKLTKRKQGNVGTLVGMGLAELLLHL